MRDRSGEIHEGDQTRINTGTFEAFEGVIREIDEAESRVTVEINVFGRPMPLELERWMVERAE